MTSTKAQELHRTRTCPVPDQPVPIPSAFRVPIFTGHLRDFARELKLGAKDGVFGVWSVDPFEGDITWMSPSWRRSGCPFLAPQIGSEGFRSGRERFWTEKTVLDRELAKGVNSKRNLTAMASTLKSDGLQLTRDGLHPNSISFASFCHPMSTSSYCIALFPMARTQQATKAKS